MPPSVPLRTSPARDEARETANRNENAKKQKKTATFVTTATKKKESSTTQPQQTTTAAESNTNNNNLNTSLYAASPMGGMYGGMGMYGAGGMGMYGAGIMGSPYAGGMMGGAGPLSGLNQMLFSVQSVIFSLGQAVQVRSHIVNLCKVFVIV